MSDKRSVYEYEGKQVDTVWDQRLCIHVGERTRAHGELFKSGRDPWGQPYRVVHPGQVAPPNTDPDDVDDDGTKRTEVERIYGIAVNRRICFVSAGPDGGSWHSAACWVCCS